MMSWSKGEMMPGELVDDTVRKLRYEREKERVKQRLAAGPSPPRRPVQEGCTQLLSKKAM